MKRPRVIFMKLLKKRAKTTITLQITTSLRGPHKPSMRGNTPR